MALWWIGNLLLLAVVIPIVILLLNRVLRPTREIKHYADDVLDHGVRLTETVDCIPVLATTCELTAAARLNVTRYGLALARMLESGTGRGSSGRRERLRAR
ncbi:MAG TPA: hypothetical protein VGR26_15540 [Acidimicrobiales bacterium]|nr:hypothetical protein [Acidimicrobiales bacterium]